MVSESIECTCTGLFETALHLVTFVPAKPSPAACVFYVMRSISMRRLVVGTNCILPQQDIIFRTCLHHRSPLKGPRTEPKHVALVFAVVQHGGLGVSVVGTIIWAAIHLWKYGTRVQSPRLQVRRGINAKCCPKNFAQTRCVFRVAAVPVAIQIKQTIWRSHKYISFAGVQHFAIIIAPQLSIAPRGHLVIQIFHFFEQGELCGARETQEYYHAETHCCVRAVWHDDVLVGHDLRFRVSRLCHNSVFLSLGLGSWTNRNVCA